MLQTKIEIIKSEAVKEFMEKLKENISDDCRIVSDEGEYVGYDCDDVMYCINNLLKEMVSEDKMKIAYLISNIEEYGKLLSFLVNNDIDVFRLYWNEREKGDRCYHIDWQEKRCYYATQKFYIDNGYEIVKPNFVCNQYGDYELWRG